MDNYKLLESIMRKQFDQVISKRKMGITWPTREFIQDTIDRLENDQYKPRAPTNKGVLGKLKIVYVNGEKTLSIRQNKNEYTVITPVENYFDILFDVHIKTEHGLPSVMLKELNRRNHKNISIKLVRSFVHCCWECGYMALLTLRSGRRYKVGRPTLLHGFIEVIDFSETPDKCYKYVMHYRDMNTMFSRLRALRTAEPYEIAKNLVKIFLDAGAPDVIHVPVSRSFTGLILKHLAELVPKFKILNGRVMPSTNKEGGIELMLKEWMAVRKTPHWSIGIYFVEFNLNTTRTKNNDSPFNSYLNRPGAGFKITENTKSLLNIYNYDEELEVDLYEHISRVLNNGNKVCFTDLSDESICDEDITDSKGEMEVKCVVCDLVEPDIECSRCNNFFHSYCVSLASLENSLCMTCIEVFKQASVSDEDETKVVPKVVEDVDEE